MTTTALPVLHRRFAPPAHFEPGAAAGYSLLPLRFVALDAARHVLTNFAGEHLVLPKETLRRFVRHELRPDDPAYAELKSRHFLLDVASSVALDLLAVKYRTKQSRLAEFTSLFMFVVTLRCEHTCAYCQVSRQTQDKSAFDMTPATADAAVEFMFRSPARSLKVEFQGGEPLLNFGMVQYVVRRVLERNAAERRDVAFVIATNLALLTDEVLDFCRAHDVYLSTSLDGPRDLHNRNRPRPGRDSYERAVDGIRRARHALGPHKVSALMTTTQASLRQPEAIVDEYLRQGFGSIFLRSVSPYGFAVRGRGGGGGGVARDYDAEEWLAFYRRALAYIIGLNRNGVPFQEEYTRLVLRRMLTPYPTGYVDLQSPAGIGIAALVFNYDGDVYASDEARMLAEMGDRTFRLGSLHADPYEGVMRGDALLGPLLDSMTEGVPACSDCGFQPYCGSDPVYHHATQGDAVGFKPSSGFCRRSMGVYRHLVALLEDDPDAAAVLKRWV
jgi:uncharacterized protein